MPKVINGTILAKDCRRLPTEAFFVDTNIIIKYKDPFGSSLNNPKEEKLNQGISDLLDRIKSAGKKSYTSLSVALEYFKYIQVTSYILYKKSRFDEKNISWSLKDFKNLRKNGGEFKEYWESYLKVFKNTFKKNFVIIDKYLNTEEIMEDFLGENIDFGDHLLYKVSKQLSTISCIFTDDSDFYRINDGNLFLITFNNTILKEADSDSNLLF